MPVIRKSEALPPQPIIVFVFGEPGVSKTSLSNTCKNPINIDFDRGLKRSYNKADGLILSNGWEEVESEFALGTFDEYDTIVVDTAKGALDDFLMAYVIKQDTRLKTNKLKMFGAIGEEFKLFVNRLRDKGKDIFIIAHGKTEQEGDIIKKVPDVTGSSSQLLLRIADQVGYISIINGQRVISFNPTETIIGKNVAGLPSITFPPKESPEWSGFAEREIIQKVKESLAKMSEEQVAALKVIEEWRDVIDATELSDEAIKDLWRKKVQIPEEHIKKQVHGYATQWLNNNGWKFNTEAKVFEPIEPVVAPPAAAEPPAANVQSPPAEEKKQSLVPPATGPRIEMPESNAAALTPATEGANLFEPEK